MKIPKFKPFHILTDSSNILIFECRIAIFEHRYYNSAVKECGGISDISHKYFNVNILLAIRDHMSFRSFSLLTNLFYLGLFYKLLKMSVVCLLGESARGGSDTNRSTLCKWKWMKILIFLQNLWNHTMSK